MFVLYQPEKQLVPIKVWLENKEQMDDVCLQQSYNLANIPYVRHWVALMPDTHQGFGMPIGGVIAVEDYIIPNAVGVDIGCGVAFCMTSLKKGDFTDAHKKNIINEILKVIPVGFQRRKEALDSETIDQLLQENKHPYEKIKPLYQEIEAARYQLGTLGGGNHFIEIQVDEMDGIGIMIHSGSRNFGYKIANYFDEKAALFCKKSGDSKASKHKLSYLKADSEAGKAYLAWMDLALAFAKENRRLMMVEVQNIMSNVFPEVVFEDIINVHHNYVTLEEHFGESLWVHRKGAIRAGINELGIIPGAMGSFSYIVEGLGSPEAFLSCSHGAGRHFSRRQAAKNLTRDEVIEDLNQLGVHIGTPRDSRVADESRFAYKDINFVMSQQTDLVKTLKELKTFMVVKG